MGVSGSTRQLSGYGSEYSPWAEWKVFNYAYWLSNHYCLALLGCFPLFLHFLTSLIKLILWLNFSIDKRQVEDVDGGHRVLLHFTAWGEQLCKSRLPRAESYSFPPSLGARKVSCSCLSHSQPHDTVIPCLSTICELLMARTLSVYLSILTTSPVMTRYSVNLTHHFFKNKVAHGLIISGKIRGVCLCGGNYKTLGICTCTDFESLGIWNQQYTLKISN